MGMSGETQAEIFTEITILEEPAFIDRYAGILGLRDNVSLVSTILDVRSFVAHGVVDSKHSYPDSVLLVRPDTYEGRQKGFEMFKDGYRRIHATEEMIAALVPPVPPKDPMTEEEVTELADKIRTIRTKQEVYAELTPLHKLGLRRFY